jgi:tetratricopeptide (TPR) repeat protein
MARNAALALVPADADYCIALDLDERLQPGWRGLLEAPLAAGVTRPRYRYTWSWTPDEEPSLIYAGDKIHHRVGYRWRHPVHEVITPTGEEVSAFVEGLEIHHHPDKEKSRATYLPLLELAMAEEPNDDRNAFYYARELMYAARYEESYAAFHRHLEIGRWAPERALSMRFLGEMCRWGRPAEAEGWYLKACAEAPGYREPWLDLAGFYVQTERGELAKAVAARALEITERQMEYLTDFAAWDGVTLESLAGLPVEEVLEPRDSTDGALPG